MSAGKFILVVLLFALAGVGAGYGAAQLVPAEAEDREPETADLVAPGAGGSGGEPDAGARPAGQAGGQKPTVDEVLATMPEEMRRDFENAPEFAAEMQAQIREAIDSGLITRESLGELQGGGLFGAGLPEAGARNAEPLTGTVASFEGGMLRLETPDDEAVVATPPDTPVTLQKTAAGAGAYLAEGAEVSVVTRPDDTGGLAAAAIIVGGAGQGAGSGRGFGGLAAVVMGSITSFADGVLTLETESGGVTVAVPDDTPVQIVATAAEAAGELTPGVSVTAFVQREADGSLSAASVNVGGGGGESGG